MPHGGRRIGAGATPEEGAEYTEWVLGIARAGCGAVRSELCGLVGEKMTAEEVRYMRELTAALSAA